LWLLLLLGYCGIGQGGWRKKFYLQNSFTATSQNVIETPAGDLITIGISSDTLNNKVFNRLTLLGTDDKGNFLWRKDYGGPGFIYLINATSIQAAIYQDSSAFYYSVVVQDTAVRMKSVLVKFNYSGDTLWQKIYRDPVEDVMSQGITRSIDNGFLLTGSFQNWTTHELPFLILKTDANGKELWRRRISKAAPNVQGGVKLIQDSISKKIVVVGHQFIGSSVAATMFSNIMVLDSLGNKIFQTTFNNSGAAGFGSLLQLKDKSFLTGGSWTAYRISGIDYYNAIVVNFDINGNIIWSKKYSPVCDQNILTGFCELPNGDILAMGNIDTIYTLPRIIRIDKTGNIKWMKAIGDKSTLVSTEGLLSMNLTRDGGAILSAWYPYMQNPHPYSIIKIDSTGCDTAAEWCRSVELGIDNFNKLTGYNFAMFPNPANNVVNIKIEAPVEKAVELVIGDVTGRTIESYKIVTGTMHTINISSFFAGVYFVKIVYEGTVIETKKLVIAR
jgi:hypothetical protein